MADIRRLRLILDCFRRRPASTQTTDRLAEKAPESHSGGFETAKFGYGYSFLRMILAKDSRFNPDLTAINLSLVDYNIFHPLDFKSLHQVSNALQDIVDGKTSDKMLKPTRIARELFNKKSKQVVKKIVSGAQHTLALT